MVLCSAFVLGVDVQVTRKDDEVLGAVGKISYSMFLGSAFVVGLDVQVIGVVMKISYNLVWCSAIVVGVDVQVARKDDEVIDVIGKNKLRYSLVQCICDHY